MNQLFLIGSVVIGLLLIMYFYLNYTIKSEIYTNLNSSKSNVYRINNGDEIEYATNLNSSKSNAY